MWKFFVIILTFILFASAESVNKHGTVENNNGNVYNLIGTSPSMKEIADYEKQIGRFPNTPTSTASSNKISHDQQHQQPSISLGGNFNERTFINTGSLTYHENFAASKTAPPMRSNSRESLEENASNSRLRPPLL